jgi:hypothetical protein
MDASIHLYVLTTAVNIPPNFVIACSLNVKGTVFLFANKEESLNEGVRSDIDELVAIAFLAAEDVSIAT